MADLLVELIEDILSRLPAIDLLRFRCVSKPWCSLIDSSRFIKLHLNRSIETNKSNLNLILQDRINHEFHFLDFDSLDCMVNLNSNSNGLNIEVWGSCNGLLCLSNYILQAHIIVLWNPSTRKYKKLLQTPIEQIEYLYPTWVSHRVFYGFGYDSTSNDYRVLRIVQFHILNAEYAHESQVDLYSLKSNSWRRVHDLPPSFSLKLHEHESVLVDGALIWSGTLKTEFCIREFSIIAFDLGVEEFRFVPQPEYSKSMIHSRVGVSGGSLCLFSCCELFGFDMWVMKDYRVKQSWTKLFSVERMGMGVPSQFLKPIACSKNGGKILIQIIQLNYTRLFQYDLKKKRMKKVMIDGLPDSFETHVWLGSLVQLDGAGGNDEN